MYTRNYYPDEERVRIPENYDGTSMLEKKDKGEDMINKDDSFAGIKISPEYKERLEDTPNENGSSVEPFTSVFKNIFKDDMPLGALLPKIGAEELLILGLAAFLFLSKSGDKECALILLFLIFVK